MASKLQPIVFRAPAIGGLDYEGEAVGRDANTARIADNVVYDEAGRLCSRKGLNQLTTTALTGSPTIEAMHYQETSTNELMIVAAEVSASHKLYSSASPFDVMTDVTGTASPTASKWQFVNFADRVVGAQAGHTLISKAATGNFAPITSGGTRTTPTGNCIHSAFGRLWAQDDDTTTGQSIISFSDLLSYTGWQTAQVINTLGNKGAIAHGYDELVAISSFDNFLIAFLRNSIVVYNNPDDPTGTLGIEKIIQGVGCIARDSVQQVGNDILFLSATGVRSFRHTVESENNLELGDMSASIRRALVAKANEVNSDSIKSAFFPEDAVYLLKTGDTVWALDLHSENVTQRAQPRWTRFPSTTWDSFAYHNGSLYIGSAGLICSYSGYQDLGEAFTTTWMSNWADFDTSRIKILKKMTSVILAATQQPVTFQWELDYGASTGSSAVVIMNDSGVSEWGIAEWGEDEFSGSNALSRISTNADKSGQVVSFGFTIVVDSTKVCIEQVSLYVTLGREAR